MPSPPPNVSSSCRLMRLADALSQHGVGTRHAEREARITQRAQRQVLDHDVGLGHEAGGEAPRGGDGALHVVRDEVHLVGAEKRVPLEEAEIAEPVAEPAAHRGFERGAFPRKLAGRGRPGEPFVCRGLGEILLRRAQRRAQVVSAHDHHLAQFRRPSASSCDGRQNAQQFFHFRFYLLVTR